MRVVHRPTKPPWRTLILCIIVIGVFLLGYQLWAPGKLFTDGRHDKKRNGVWIQHGWLGDDTWFNRYERNPRQFRDPAQIIGLKNILTEHHITDVYPHLCPSQTTGEIAALDPKQTQQFLLIMDDLRVVPWVGGVLGEHVFLKSKQWRTRFVTSIRDLLNTYPAFAGIHINIEPLPSGDAEYLTLLRELKTALPENKILSIAAYPPPTLFQRSLYVHWEKTYYERVAQEVDQMVIMMYDTSLWSEKLYQQLMASWTKKVLDWTGTTDVLLGVPAYDDEGVMYHYPHVENLKNSLLGIHAGLARYPSLPENYQGISIYCEWEMAQEEWDYLKANYCRNL